MAKAEKRELPVLDRNHEVILTMTRDEADAVWQCAGDTYGDTPRGRGAMLGVFEALMPICSHGCVFTLNGTSTLKERR